MSGEWNAEDRQQPWARRVARKVGDDRQIEGMRCPFCGNTQLLLGYADIAEDHERLDLYCNASGCDAREMVILVTRDGTHGNAARGDVQALNAIDSGRTVNDGAIHVETLAELLDVDEEEMNRQTFARRNTSYPVMDLRPPAADPQD